MAYEISSGDVKVAALTAFMVLAIGSLTFLTAEEPAPEPPRPVPQEILDKCAASFLPRVCVEIEMAKRDLGRR